MNRTYLFIDGTNLYAAQYKLFGPKKYLNFNIFISFIEKKLNVKFDKIFFYASYSPQHKEDKKYLINEFEFYKCVKTNKKVEFFKGYRSKTSGKEKEVDVKLSVDLVGYGLLDYYSNAYLMTGDADFLQACGFINKYSPNKKIELICMANQIMFKGIYYYPSTILQFSKQLANNPPIAKKANVLNIDKELFIMEIKKDRGAMSAARLTKS